MGLQPRIGGSWKTTQSISAKVGGAWRSVSKVFVRVAGTWREVWSAVLKATISMKTGADSYFQKYSDHVELFAYDTVNGGGIVTLITDKMVNLTGVSEVQIDWEHTAQSSIMSDAGITVGTTRNGSLNGGYDARYYTGSPFSRRVTALNVSSLSGNYYIRVHSTVNGGVVLWTRVRVYRILLDGEEIWNASDPGSFI